MSLTTKRKPPTHARKRQAQHHRRGKNYLKIYHPYLPMAAILAGGGIVNAIWDVSASVASADSGSPTLSSTKLASLGAVSDTIIYAVLAVTFAAFVVFLASHFYRFHRWLNRGEALASQHPGFDVGLVLVITVGVVLTRT